MSEKRNLLAEHYYNLQYDKTARQRLIDDPKAGLEEQFGVGTLPEGDYKIEAVPQDSDTITILLPSPVNNDTSDEALDAASRRIYDILFTDGVGGFLTPDDSLTWILRDMRSNWLK